MTRLIITRVLPVICAIFIAGNSYAQHLEILYVNSNTGAAAGGHVALKLGNDVFHYQFYPDDRFLLVRESWDYFNFIYTRLRNRTIYGARCSVSEHTFTRVKNHFTTELAAQQLDFSKHRHLLDQKKMLTGLGAGSLDVTVRGLGFFAVEDRQSQSSRALRSTISKRVGDKYLREKRTEITNQLESKLKVLIGGQSDGDVLLRKIQELSDLKKKLTAFDMLMGARAVDPSTLTVGRSEQLSRIETVNLEYHLNRRLQVLTRLLDSERLDVGEAMLIEIARCQTLLESLTTGVLVTLDPYPDETKTNQLDLSDTEMQDYLMVLLKLLSKQYSALLVAEVGSTGSEIDYSYLQIENVGGRLAEVGKAVNGNQGIRVSPNMMIPTRSATTNIEVPAVADETIEAAGKSIEFALLTKEMAFEEKYRYSLINHNCVNELLRTLNGSFINTAEAGTALGDWIDPVADRVVIPNNFFYQVSNRYHVEEIKRYPSRRVAQVETMQKRNDPVEVWLREGNTLSTTLYRKRSEDTPFLFFTDDVMWFRPLLGAANLIWSTAHTVAGVFTTPVRGVEPVQQALRGMFYSTPELLFFNIRKGTYLHDMISEGGHEL